MDLGHMHCETTGRIQRFPTPFAFEMLGLLMGVQDLDIVEVSFAVVTPWTRKLLLRVILVRSLLSGDHLRV